MNQDRVVLFMKGEPDAPRCGFSRKTVAILREQDVEFSHFDILTDERVRSGKCLFLFYNTICYMMSNVFPIYIVFLKKYRIEGT